MCVEGAEREREREREREKFKLGQGVPKGEWSRRQKMVFLTGFYKLISYYDL
jgi:hypothetical protein